MNLVGSLFSIGSLLKKTSNVYNINLGDLFKGKFGDGDTNTTSTNDLDYMMADIWRGRSRLDGDFVNSLLKSESNAGYILQYLTGFVPLCQKEVISIVPAVLHIFEDLMKVNWFLSEDTVNLCFKSGDLVWKLGLLLKQMLLSQNETVVSKCGDLFLHGILKKEFVEECLKDNDKKLCLCLFLSIGGYFEAIQSNGIQHSYGNLLEKAFGGKLSKLIKDGVVNKQFLVSKFYDYKNRLLVLEVLVQMYLCGVNEARKLAIDIFSDVRYFNVHFVVDCFLKDDVHNTCATEVLYVLFLLAGIPNEKFVCDDYCAKLALIDIRSRILIYDIISRNFTKGMISPSFELSFVEAVVTLAEHCTKKYSTEYTNDVASFMLKTWLNDKSMFDFLSILTCLKGVTPTLQEKMSSIVDKVLSGEIPEVDNENFRIAKSMLDAENAANTSPAG